MKNRALFRSAVAVAYMVALLPLFCSAQEQVQGPAGRQVVKDSTGQWEHRTGIFYETRYLFYDNGEAESATIRLGDSLGAAVYAMTRIVEESRKAHQQVIEAAQVRVINKAAHELSQISTDRTGKNALREIRVALHRVFVDTVGVDKAWNHRKNGVVTAVQLRLLANGNLRISGLPNAGGNKQITVYSDRQIRIDDYPTGSTGTMFWLNIDPNTKRLRWDAFNADFSVAESLILPNVQQQRK